MRRAAFVPALVALLLAAGCGSSETDTQPQPTPQPTAKKEDFPSAKGKTLDSLRADLPKGPNLEPTMTTVSVGKQRFGFVLRDDANKLISGADLAIYTTDHDGSNARGPYLAHSESLDVRTNFRAQNTDPGDAKSIYVAEVPIKRPGKPVITGVARLDGRLVATTGFEIPVQKPGTKGLPPEVGDQAISVDTPTITSVGGDAAKISTRIPPAEPMLRENLADVLGKKPVVLVFATPQLCASRICGPVVDVAMQVQADHGDGIAFIQQEIYRDNDISKGYTPQVQAWRLPTEPWIFVIDREGIIRARFEGAVSVGELERAVALVAPS
ncbi:MAG TPA: hypothetical protein VFR97_08300 [Capillimicrobium sp.]|nr:hypothetical protein [Capillimicrobium sp.]